MRASLAQLHQRLGVTTVYVTHDQVEAMTLGQRVAVMRDGRVLQVDEPQRLYKEPQDLFVAGFIGSPAMNLVEARIADGEAVFGEHRVPLSRHRVPADGASLVVLGIRPESFEDAAFSSSGLPTLDVRVAVLEELGSDAYVFFEVDTKAAGADTRDSRTDGETTLIETGALLSARVDPRTTARVGDRLRLAVDPARLHFFDLESGASLLTTAVPSAETAPTSS
jgi:multiple sugar transport system ATP-binding protein